MINDADIFVPTRPSAADVGDEFVVQLRPGLGEGLSVRRQCLHLTFINISASTARPFAVGYIGRYCLLGLCHSAILLLTTLRFASCAPPTAITRCDSLDRSMSDLPS